MENEEIVSKISNTKSDVSSSSFIDSYVRNTKSLADIYENCKMTMIRPSIKK